MWLWAQDRATQKHKEAYIKYHNLKKERMEKETDIDTVISERDKTHGPFNKQAELTQVLKETLRQYGYDTNCTLQQREALDMIMHKIARIVVSKASYQDHWDDIAGYAKIGNKKYD